MIRPVLETRHLLLLHALDDTGTLHGAARRLHLTPSALSQQLRDLEGALGGSLFHRQWRRLAPTAAGRRLTDASRVVLEGLGRAEQEARELLRGKTGTLRVATACTQSYDWLPRVLQSFHASFPAVEVTVVDGGGAPCDELGARRIDLVLTTSDAPRVSRVRYRALFRDELVAVVSSDHPFAERASVEPRALANEHLWIDAGALRPTTVFGRALAKGGGITPRKVTLTPNGSLVAVEMARANLGITVLPRWAATRALEHRDLATVRLGKRGLWCEWSLAMRDETVEPALQAFADALTRMHPRVGRADAPRPRR